MGNLLRIVAAMVTAAATIGLAPVATSASTVTGRDYGEHVVHCTQATGFSGDHNPGMHRGHAGFRNLDHQC